MHPGRFENHVTYSDRNPDPTENSYGIGRNLDLDILVSRKDEMSLLSIIYFKRSEVCILLRTYCEEKMYLVSNRASGSSKGPDIRPMSYPVHPS